MRLSIRETQVLENQQVNYLKKRCPICKMIFSYPEGNYEPKTCNKWDCIYKYHHGEALKRRELREGKK